MVIYLTDSERFISAVIPVLGKIEKQLEEDKRHEVSKYNLEWAKAIFNSNKGGFS